MAEPCPDDGKPPPLQGGNRTQRSQRRAALVHASRTGRRITIIVDAETHAELEGIARRTNKPLTFVVRRGMRMVIREERDKANANAA